MPIYHAPIRYPDDAIAHTALGFFLLADAGDPTQKNASGTLEQAADVFRKAIALRTGSEDYVPATRGLAVALRRYSLSAEEAPPLEEVNWNDWESER